MGMRPRRVGGGAGMRAGVGIGVLMLLGCTGAGSGAVDTRQPGDAMAPDDRLFLAPPLQPCDSRAAAPARLRVVSWNIFAARAATLDAIAEVLASMEADVMVLQEVHVYAGGVNQAEVLAERLGHSYIYAGAVEDEDGSYGQAILTRMPLTAARRISLQSVDASQPRIALDTVLCAGATSVRVIDAHLDQRPGGTERNTRDLLTAMGDGMHVARAGTLLAGDFNAEPGSSSIDMVLAAGLRDVVAAYDDSPTWKHRRIDYVFVAGPVVDTVQDARVVRTTRSDHHLVVTDFAGTW